MRKLLQILAVFFLVGSCGKKKDMGLSITISPESSYVLLTPVFSCAQLAGIEGASTSDAPAVGSYRVVLGRPIFTWKKTEQDLAIDQVVLVFNHAALGGKFVYRAIDLNELRGIIRGTSGSYPAAWDSSKNVIVRTATEESPTVLSSACELRFGGISISDTTPTFTADGIMKVLGRALKYDTAGNVTSEEPVYAEVSIHMKYIKY